MKVKINQDEKLWIQMLMQKFGLSKKQAIEKLTKHSKKQT
jgi:hypothetical protein